MLEALLSRLKQFKELVVVRLFFATILGGIAQHYATRTELNEYKCINSATTTMLIQSIQADLFDQQIKACMREKIQLERRINAPDNGDSSDRDQLRQQQLELQDKLDQLKERRAGALSVSRKSREVIEKQLCTSDEKIMQKINEQLEDAKPAEAH